MAIAPLPRAEVSPEPLDEGLFSPYYNPRRVRFTIVHWEELAQLVETPRSSEHLGTHLAREYDLLRDGHHRGLDCLCRLDGTPPCAHVQGGSHRRYRASGSTIALLLADLVAAANTLPLDWYVTRAIYQAQLRIGEWELRYSIFHGTPGVRPKKPQLDARPAFPEAAERMARELGWRPRGEGGA